MQGCYVIVSILCCLFIQSASYLATSQRFVKLRQLARARSVLSTATFEMPECNSRSHGIVDVNEELKKSFMSYAMSTILGRALPDVRDGLKPVHRRVLFAMHGLGLSPTSTHRKCARIVGEVLGKYHPHGDQSVYDALVRLSQDFITNHPLISGHGNFGSIDNDPPAAMRYTEAKLSALAQDVLFADIKESTVDWCPNFDGNEMEPLILPSRLPLLLINGASGIAVGMATNIPPHNLGEVINGLVALIRNPNITDEELLNYIPSPDFPTGGIIHGISGFHDFAKLGHGSIMVRAKVHEETIATGPSNSNKTALVITELPYGANKAALLGKIAELVNERKIDGIADLRDESDRNGIRIVIELKRNTFPQIVENNLWKHTGLQTFFPGNLLALSDDGTHPDRLSLKCVLSKFVKFRFGVIRRRTAFHLASLKKRDHIVVGLIAAIKKIDDIVQLIKESDGVEAAINQLMGLNYNFTKDQAESILGLTLRRITSLEGDKLSMEHGVLQENIANLENLMVDDKLVYDVMINESLSLKEKYAIPRRSQILEKQVELSAEDLVPNERSMISITSSGYIKRVPLSMFESQSRGGRGKFCTKFSREEENVAHFLVCRDHDTILIIAETGVAYDVKAYNIPLGTRTSKGVPLPSIVAIGSSSISAVFALDDTLNHENLVLLTEQGFTKKTNSTIFRSMNTRGLKMLSLNAGDKLKWVRRCKSLDDVLITTRLGYGIKFNEENIHRSSRYSRGVRAVSLRKGDAIVDMDIVPNEPSQKDDRFLLAVTQMGFGKKILIKSIKSQSRFGKGAKIINFKIGLHSEDQLATTRICSDGDEVVISTQNGVVIRQSVKNISQQSKAATGVILQSLDLNDRVLNVDIVADAK